MRHGFTKHTKQIAHVALIAGSLLLASAPGFAQNSASSPEDNPGVAASTFFVPGNLVVAVEGCGVHGGTCTNVPNGSGTGVGNSSVGGYGDNQAAPLTLFQYAPSGTASVSYVNSLVLPQAASGADLPLSGEYGSSSEATVQLSGTGQYLTLMGYGINAATFNSAYAPGFTGDPYGAAPSGALAQSGSLTGQSYTPVSRVLTLIDANGNVNTVTGINNIFNTNNPRSAYTATGSTAYVSGQGSGADATGGVFHVNAGVATASPTAITGLDASSNTIAQDTRTVQIYNGTLYVSVDSKEGSGNSRDFIGTLGAPPATSLYNGAAGPTELTGFGNSGGTGKVTITTGANSNGNGLNTGDQINISPVNYFFASPSVLYVADSGVPKNNSATSTLGNGGLEKWTNSSPNGSGTWSLAYTLHSGLNLVANTNTDGASGVYGLTGIVSGSSVLLYATNYTLSDLDPTYLYGITDTLSFTTASQAAGETFSLLDTAPHDSNFKGVSFTPTIPAGSVEVTSSPSGFAFTSSGTGCAPGTYITPITLAWTATSNCTLQAASPQSDLGYPYVFQQWQNGSTSPSLPVTAPATTATYTATFVPEYSISFTSVTHNFGSAALNTTAATYGVKVTNTAAQPFSSTGINLTGSSEFTDATNCPATLAAGANCEIVFSFTPTAAGAATATWSFGGATSGTEFAPSNGGTLSGTGFVSGAVTLTTAKHNFGTQTHGTKSAVFGAVLTNSTSASVTISVAAPTGNTADFTTTADTCGAALAAGASCNLQYEFSPVGTGSFSEFIGITANGGSTPVTVGGTAYTGLTLVGAGD